MNEWLKAITDNLIKKVDKVPEAWKTSKQIADDIDKTQRMAMYHIKELKELGLVETKTFKVMMDDRILPVKHYKIKSK